MTCASTNPFARPTMRARVERLASTVGFIALLASWCTVYVTVCPPDARPAQHHVRIAQVRP